MSEKIVKVVATDVSARLYPIINNFKDSMESLMEINNKLLDAMMKIAVDDPRSYENKMMAMMLNYLHEVVLKLQDTTELLVRVATMCGKIKKEIEQ